MKEIRWIQLYNYVSAKLESSRKFQLAMTVTLKYVKKRPAIVLKSRDDFKLVGHRSSTHNYLCWYKETIGTSLLIYEFWAEY